MAFAMQRLVGGTMIRSLDFPPAVRIRNRKYRYVDELDAFDERQRAAAPLDKKLNGES